MIPQPVISVFDDMSECTDANVSLMLPLVPQWRREQAMAFRFTRQRFACLKSMLMLESLLESTFGYTGNMKFVYNEHGKPSLAGRTDIHFNLSHCRHAIAAAVWDRPVGIDVESFRDVSDSLLRYAMNASEIAEIEKSPTPGTAFIELWTKKEATFKLLGTGITDNLHDILSEPVSIRTRVESEKGYVLSTAVSL